MENKTRPVKMILAIDSAEGIGDHSKIGMPWHFKEDLKHFSQVTKDHFCVMGSNTFDKIEPIFDDCTLPDRHCIVVSRNLPRYSGHAQKDTTFMFEHVIEDTVRLISEDRMFTDGDPCPKGIFIIGGAYIYRKFMDSGIRFKELYVTRIHKDYKCPVKLEGFDDWLDHQMAHEKLFMTIPSRKRRLLEDRNTGDRVEVSFEKYIDVNFDRSW